MEQPNRISAASRRKLMEERKKSREASAIEKEKFESCLNLIHDKDIINELQSLIKTIQREGERLAHFKSMHQLEHYKKKVREFIQVANRKTFKIKPTGYVDSEGDYATQLVVEKVDNALSDLTRFVLEKESEPLKILEQLDLIKGMLTDLYQ